jgi:Inner membrane component of T3SS, cytoplasmic domain
MRFRLRYLHHDLALNEGQFVVGRSAACQLSLDDALISRRHAMIVVAGDTVTVEDLASRNGVLVNGVRITGKTLIRPGDKIVVGQQELTLLGARALSSKDTMSLPVANSATLPRIPAVVDTGAGSERPEAIDRTAAGQDENVGGEDSSMVRRVTAFKLLGGVADKALAMGRVDEAERLLTGPLNEVIEASRAGKHVSPWIVDIAARLSAKLATATAKGVWADYVIEVYQTQGRPCPAPVVDELNNAFRKVNAIDLVRLRAYLAALREKAATLGPAERFLLQRIEGLERLAALR